MRYSQEYIEGMKAEIPRVAFELFSRRGIESVTVQNIADTSHYSVASLYRYYGTKRNLVIQIAAQQWRRIADAFEKSYEERGGACFTAYQDLEFYLTCYVGLYQERKDLLRFNRNFEDFILRENAPREEMAPYYEAVAFFTEFFHKRYEKAYRDHTIRTDLPEQDVYFGMMQAMLSSATKFAVGTLYPFGKEDFTFALEMQKEAYLHYMTLSPAE